MSVGLAGGEPGGAYPAEEDLIDAAEDALDFTSAARFAGEGDDQRHMQLSGYLLEVV